MTALILPSTEIATRLEFPELWNRLGYDGVGVEIGTDRGVFAAHILKHWKGTLLQCIDPWKTGLADYEDPLICGPRDADFLQTVMTLSQVASHRVRIFRELSSEAVHHIIHPVDWVYIDPNHALEYVRKDITNYWPLIHWGGMMAGHDFGVPEFPGVTQAVVEFAEATGLCVYITRERTPYKSWYVYKPDSWRDEVKEVLETLREAKRIAEAQAMLKEQKHVDEAQQAEEAEVEEADVEAADIEEADTEEAEAEKAVDESEAQNVD